MKKSKFLITAFPPFLNNELNPSLLLLEDLKKITNDNLYLLELPVSYNKAPKILKEKILEINPDYIISLGLAQARKTITIEKIALNYKHAHAYDNDNIMCLNEKINSDSPLALETNINIEELIQELNLKDVYSSYHAGTYVCNLVYYIDLSLNKNSLFIHLPSLENSSQINNFNTIIKILEYLRKKAPKH